MKKLTPIGVLIGIVVFASTVSHVAQGAAPQKCWKKADNTKIQDFKIMTDAFDAKNWKTDCSPSDKCLQYHPAASKPALTGPAEVTVECGKDCSETRAAATRIGTTYQCFECTASDGSACKKITDVKLTYFTECYDYKGLQKGGDRLYLKKILCYDKCKYIDDATAKTITVGCEAQINAIASGIKLDCSGGNADCEDKIIGQNRCWKDAGAVVESVTEITEAFAREKWTVLCTGAQKCLQYYPEAANNKGKVQVLFECGDTCADANAKMKKTAGFTCTACETSKTLHGCKLITDAKAEKQCYTYTGPKNKATDMKKIYCLDSCQYADSEGGKSVTVGCAEDIKSAGTPTNCPAEDPTCEKMIKPASSGPDGGSSSGPSSGSSSGPSSGSSSGSNNTNADKTTTAARKNSNKLTSSPICLIVSMVIAVSQYMQKF